MKATLLDGAGLAQRYKKKVAEAIAQSDVQPGLAVILVGDNPASRTYVNGKNRDCKECGIFNQEYALPDTTTQAELLALIEELNARSDIHGILVQLPLPPHINEETVLLAIAPEKDVDGFHPYNVGMLCTGQGGIAPCTPAGVMELLADYGIDPKGKHCVVVGRSNIVGKPMALLLLAGHGTVTICHSKTPNLAEICKTADILVAAVGRVNLITADMVKEGAVVVDVAMNRNEAGKLCGDVDFEAVSQVAGYITPVPGGVGPMTRAMLMGNTLNAAQSSEK